MSDTESAITITNRDRVIFPEAAITKGDLAHYYAAIAMPMLRFAASRPLSLVRCPQGRARKCFFQKHDHGGFGPAVHRLPIREKDGALADYLFVDDPAGILACVQMGTIEFHGWCAPARDVESPDRLIFDLDPDPGLGFAEVVQAALLLRNRLADLGLTSFALLSGGKGVHVLAPLVPRHGWDRHTEFARIFARSLADTQPESFTATMSKARRKGRIFIDWLRNARGATAILPWSARARPGAPVAVPVCWSELDGMENAHPFSVRDSATLLERAASADLAGWGLAEQALPPAETGFS